MQNGRGPADSERLVRVRCKDGNRRSDRAARSQITTRNDKKKLVAHVSWVIIEGLLLTSLPVSAHAAPTAITITQSGTAKSGRRGRPFKFSA